MLKPTIIMYNSLCSGFPVVSNLVEMCNKTDVDLEQRGTTHQGHKRKAEEAQINETYIPSKRISPFLNTPKERKDERKKVLKISIKKLKQLDDPEIFLRRTVLVNNTMKRLQTEVRDEKLRTRKHEMSRKKIYCGYGVLNNNCLSNSYLFDDPFLSGVHEKITDDMTDTLMHNVFHDKPGDTASADNSNSISCQVNNTHVESRVDSSQLTSLDISSEMSSGVDTRVRDNSSSSAILPSMPGSGDISNHVSLDTQIADTMTDITEMSDNRCDELVRDDRCNDNNGTKISCKDACNDNCEPMELGDRETTSTQNIETQPNEMNGMNNEQSMLCGRLHLTNSVFENSTDVLIQHSETVQKHLHNENDKSLKTSKSVTTDLEHVSENTCGLDLLDLGNKLDQKSLPHSFNTFLSDFDITHRIPVPLSYKES